MCHVDGGAEHALAGGCGGVDAFDGRLRRGRGIASVQDFEEPHAGPIAFARSADLARVDDECVVQVARSGVERAARHDGKGDERADRGSHDGGGHADGGAVEERAGQEPGHRTDGGGAPERHAGKQGARRDDRTEEADEHGGEHHGRAQQLGTEQNEERARHHHGNEHGPGARGHVRNSKQALEGWRGDHVHGGSLDLSARLALAP